MLLKSHFSKRLLSISIHTTNSSSLLSGASPRLKKPTEKRCQSPNPFRIPSATELFGTREEDRLKNVEEQKRISSLSLVERNNELKPNVAIHTLRQTPSKLSNISHEDEEYRPTSSVAGQPQRLTDFISQKREIFMLQLLIDQKNKEIKHLSQDSMTQEQFYIETETEIEETSVKVKTMTSHIETSIAQARRSAELAARRKTDLQKELKMRAIALANTNSEISRNQFGIESYISFKSFLEQMTPEGRDPLKYFDRPEKLITQLAQLENENLFLSRQISAFLEASRSDTTKLDLDIKAENDAILKEEEKIKMIPVEGGEDITLKQGNAREMKVYEDQVAILSRLVQRTYARCFKQIADVGTMSQLERIENELERIYAAVENVEPTFLKKKAAAKEKERREQQRKDYQEEKEHLQEEKKAHSLARSTRPVKKREGRPLVARTVPRSKEKKDDEKLRAQMIEQRRQEELLFGPISE